MIATTVRSRSVWACERVDARFFTSAGTAADERMSLLEAEGTTMSRLDQLGKVWAPLRFKRNYAGGAEQSVGYLRPYDVFEYLPTTIDRLSIRHSKTVSSLIVRTGQILQTCSGRNLGPCAYVDSWLDGTALSHDMVRIEIDDEVTRYFVFAYLRTPTAQALLRRGRSGSVIDHLTVGDVGRLTVPLIQLVERTEVAALIGSALRRIETTRLRLAVLRADLEERLPGIDTVPPKQGWTVSSSKLLSGRVDVAYNAPHLAKLRADLTAMGARKCGDLAVAHLPIRYKRYYVEEEHGRPILSGRQILQIDPVNLRYVSDRSFKVPEEYVVRKGETVLGGVGRSEGRLGTPALVTSERDGWLASNDVMRLQPRPSVNAGALWLAFAASTSQAQVKALPFGSVVDHMNPDDVEGVLLPPVDDDMGAEAEACWDQMALARHEIDEAVTRTELRMALGTSTSR